MASFEKVIGISPSNNAFKLQVNWHETNVDNANNKSTVVVDSAKVIKVLSSSPFNSSCATKLTINGTSFSYSGAYSLDGASEITVFSNKSVVVPHNADGTKSISISFSFDGLLQNWYPNGSVSKTVSLTPIPRADDFSIASSLTLGTATTITISTNYLPNHKISFQYGGKTDTSVMHGNDERTFSATPSSSFASTFPSTSKSVTAKAVLYSYTSGGTLVGSVTKNVTLVIPDSYAPTFSVSTSIKSELPGAIGEKVSELISRCGVCLTGISSLNLTASNVAAQANATVKKAVLEITGWSGNVTDSASRNSYTINSGVITIAGNRTPSCTVYDSRGLSRKINASAITVRSWLRPSVMISNEQRNDTSIEFDVSKTYMESIVDSTGQTVNLADESYLVAPTIEIYYKRSTTQTYTQLSGVSITSNHITIDSLSQKYAYDIKVVLSDYLGDTKETEFAVSSAQIDFHMRDAHARFGTYINAEDEPLKIDPCLDVDWNIFLAEGVYIKDAQGNWHNIINGLRSLIQ